MPTTKTLISFATSTARGIVRKTLEPHPLGLTIQDLYKNIHKQFPDEKENPGFLPPPPKVTAAGETPQHLYIPHYDHPIRSMGFLKRVVLQQMLERDEVEHVHLSKRRIKVAAGKRKSTILDGIPNDERTEQWRWRLVAEHELVDTPDLSSKEAPFYSRKRGVPVTPAEIQDDEPSRLICPHDRVSDLTDEAFTKQREKPAISSKPQKDRKKFGSRNN